MYQTGPDFNLKISHRCCIEFKKKPIKHYMKESGRKITLTGMMKAEGGQRSTLNCIVTDKDGSLKKFHPMAICSNEWEDWYIKERQIKLAELYYPPYSFDRTGCLCCPFALDLQNQLDILEKVAPDEKKRAEWLWKPVYDEYRKVGYRLRKEDINQPSLFD
jgi:3'-phosphoadenosine 5'-phosphosulfate sulfotransferase (PAPS reductase)/FAD synthetase